MLIKENCLGYVIHWQPLRGAWPIISLIFRKDNGGIFGWYHHLWDYIWVNS